MQEPTIVLSLTSTAADPAIANPRERADGKFLSNMKIVT